MPWGMAFSYRHAPNFCGMDDYPEHPWPLDWIERQSLDYLLQTHNNMYRELQKFPERSNVRGTASRIEEYLRTHGAVMLGEVGGGGNINVQLSAPAPPTPPPVQAQPPQQNIVVHHQVQQPPVQQPAQQNVIYHQQVQQPPVQQPAQQNVIYHQQVQPQLQQNVVYQQLQQPQVLSIPAPVATLTMTSTPVQGIVIGGIVTPRIGYVRSPRSFGRRGFFDYDSDSDSF